MAFVKKEIIQKLKEGDMVAFDSVYNAFSSKLYGFVLGFLKNHSDAEEIVQEVFVKIWASRQKLDEYSSFSKFIFTIAYNSSISLIRKRLNEEKYMAYLKSLSVGTSHADLVDEIQFNELETELNKLVAQLPKRQKEVYEFSRIEGLSNKEIAKKLDISPNTVENHMGRALKFLRENLRRDSLLVLFFINLFL